MLLPKNVATRGLPSSKAQSALQWVPFTHTLMANDKSDMAFVSSVGVAFNAVASSFGSISLKFAKLKKNTKLPYTDHYLHCLICTFAPQTVMWICIFAYFTHLSAPFFSILNDALIACTSSWMLTAFRVLYLYTHNDYKVESNLVERLHDKFS